jgi:hypothetical protein
LGGRFQYFEPWLVPRELSLRLPRTRLYLDNIVIVYIFDEL